MTNKELIDKMLANGFLKGTNISLYKEIAEDCYIFVIISDKYPVKLEVDLFKYNRHVRTYYIWDADTLHQLLINHNWL